MPHHFLVPATNQRLVHRLECCVQIDDEAPQRRGCHGLDQLDQHHQARIALDQHVHGRAVVLVLDEDITFSGQKASLRWRRAGTHGSSAPRKIAPLSFKMQSGNQAIRYLYSLPIENSANEICNSLHQTMRRRSANYVFLSVPVICKNGRVSNKN